MASYKLNIQTTLGSTILDLESRVNVHLNKDIYLNKGAIDLNVGDSVIYQKEFIETTLEEVESLLDLSPRYMHAKMQVTENNCNRKHVPLLRTELWRGILKKKGAYDLALEGIIKNEEEDLGNSDYDEAVEMVGNLIKGDSFEISESSIRNWLKGEVYAPRDWRMFTSLAKINPIFKEFDDTNQSIDGKYYNYKLFVTARQRVMAYLARLKGNELKDYKQKTEEENLGRLNINLNEELDIVVKSLMEEKGKDYALAKIISIEKLPSKHNGVRVARKNPKHRLSKGIETGKANFEMRTKGKSEFFQDYFFVEGLFSTSLNIYLTAKYVKEFEPFLLKNNKIKGCQGMIKQLFSDKYNLPNTYQSSRAFQRVKHLLEDDEKVNHAEKVTDLLLDDLFKGKFDETFLLPQDSYKKLLEVEHKLRTARPRIFREHENINDEYDYLGEKLVKIKSESFISQEDKNELRVLAYQLKEAYDSRKRLMNKIEENYPIKFREVSCEGAILCFMELKEEGKEGRDIEKIIDDYDLGNFREIIKHRFNNICPEIADK